MQSLADCRLGRLLALRQRPLSVTGACIKPPAFGRGEHFSNPETILPQRQLDRAKTIHHGAQNHEIGRGRCSCLMNLSSWSPIQPQRSTVSGPNLIDGPGIIDPCPIQTMKEHPADKPRSAMPCSRTKRKSGWMIGLQKRNVPTSATSDAPRCLSGSTEFGATVSLRCGPTGCRLRR